MHKKREPGEGATEWESPRHQIELPAYQIGKFPVTNKQYEEFVRDTQPAKAVARFFGQHGRAVVGQKGPWHSAFHKGLAQTMNQTLGRFGQIKLKMAT